MRCRVNENFKVFHGHSPVELEKGQVVSGSLAELLLRSASRKVIALEDEDQATEEGQQQEPEPRHRQPCIDGSVCGGPHCPPETRSQTGGGESPNPPDPAATRGGDTELDIDAPISDVLAWVGDDTKRAAEALGQEQAKDTPRSTLVKQLEKLADGGA